MPSSATVLRYLRSPSRLARGVRNIPAQRAELKRQRNENTQLRADVKRLKAKVKDLEQTRIRDRYRPERPDSLERFGVQYPVGISRHEVARKRVLEELAVHDKLRFLDAGGRDGKLKGLLGEDLPSELFHDRVSYTGMDIGAEEENVIVGDICQADLPGQYPDFIESFDIIYSNNVFEHLRQPFVAMSNLHQFVKPGGIVIINAPFAWRYHAVPGDYFRYTHTGLIALLEENGISDFDVLDSGFDIQERRKNRNGIGMRGDFFQNDICPEDEFGAWREHWQAVLIYRRTAAGC